METNNRLFMMPAVHRNRTILKWADVPNRSDLLTDRLND
jgi:hypothetical protein